MGVFKRRKQKSSDSQGSCSSGNSSGSNSSLEKKQQTPQSNPLKSSLHSSEGGSTSGYNTCQSGSYGTCRSRQSNQKNVRFSQVHVREYERSLGDNPSCSSGAPIGIGWGFVTALEMEVEEYERKHKRGRTQNEIILSRHEREALLKEWYTTEKEIIESTRETLKIKFQRRRSVRNALKMEYLSSFGKGLKKVLMRQRKSEELYLTTVPELSGLVTTGPPPITTTTAMEAEFPQVVEPENDEHNDSNENNDDDHHHPNPRASLLHKQSSSFDDMIDDATSAVSGITFGDSTTTSAYEMEMFHRELELEMFGEEPDELDESFSQQGRQHNNVVMEYNGSNNSMSIVSGSHEEEMSSSSGTMHSFQSPNNNNNNNNYYNDPQPRYNSPQMDNSPIAYSALQKQYEQQQQQQQMFLRQYNPYARTSAYRGYSLRDAYRNNNQFSAFDMANQMTQQQQSLTPNRLDVVEVTEPDDDDEDEFVMGPRQYHGGHNTTPHGPPHLIPPMYPSYNTNVRYSSDDSRSWEEFYYERGSDGSSHYDSSMTNHSYMSMDYTARTDRTQHC